MADNEAAEPDRPQQEAWVRWVRPVAVGFVAYFATAAAFEVYVNHLRSEPPDVGAQNVLGLVAWGVGSTVTGLVARARTILDWIIAFVLLTGAQTLFVMFGPLVISVITLGHGA